MSSTLTKFNKPMTIKDATAAQAGGVSGGSADPLPLATTLFEALAAELRKQPKLVGALHALFEIRVTRRGVRKGEWFVLLRGQEAAPEISRGTIPKHAAARAEGGETIASSAQHKMPVVIIEIDQRDLFNFFAGGLNPVRAITSGKVRVAGDLEVATSLEQLFRKAGGVEKTMEYLRAYEAKRKAKL